MERVGACIARTTALMELNRKICDW
jgi:hypothetical protein